MTAEKSADYELTPLSGDQYTSCLCGGERKTLSWNMNPSVIGEGRPPSSSACAPPRADGNERALSLAGVVELSVTAEAVASDIFCGNEIVTVLERGRVDNVKRTLIVKVGHTPPPRPLF